MDYNLSPDRQKISLDEYLTRLASGLYAQDPLQYVLDVFVDPRDTYLSVVPDDWQVDVLKALKFEDQIAVASGHGIGKSALSSWIVHWFIATHKTPQIVVTANTLAQLTGKTWRELKKWNNHAVNASHFKWTATKFMHRAQPDTWYASAVAWSLQNTEAFAGTHETSGVLMLFDEASAIDDEIFNVASGALTTEGAKWILFGNPTRTTGRFRDCFAGGAYEHRWWTKQVDSRNAAMTDKVRLEEWREDFGEDSDFYRIRVRGEFPRQSSSQFISAEPVDAAMARQLDPREYYREARILGVDVAKGGLNGDRHSICRRQGRRSWLPRVLTGIDTMELVSRVVDEYNSWDADLICVDGTGVGVGVVHRLRQLGYPVVDVMVGTTAQDPVQYADTRTELWGLMRDWLRLDVQLDESKDLKKELTAPLYDHTGKMQIRLEPKKYTRKALGGDSPDMADSLMLTFANNLAAPIKFGVLPVQAPFSNRGWWNP